MKRVLVIGADPATVSAALVERFFEDTVELIGVYMGSCVDSMVMAHLSDVDGVIKVRKISREEFCAQYQQPVDDTYFRDVMSGRVNNPLMQLRAQAPVPELFTRFPKEKAQWKRERKGRHDPR